MATPTPEPVLLWTQHGLRRCDQRGLSPAALHAALAWGLPRRAGGGDTFFHVGRRSVALARRAGVDIRQHLGVTVIETRWGRIKTVYRNHQAPRPSFRRGL
jgi:hypothetical protein